MSVLVPVRHESDVVVARARAREIGREAGLSAPAIAELATAVTEIARNIVVHAGSGEVRIRAVCDAEGRRGVAVEARDEGPGIADLSAALSDHVSTGEGLGLGLPSARRLVDELEIRSQAGLGTCVSMKKWAG